MRSRGMRSSRSSVVSSRVSKVRRLRLLMPIRGVLSASARSSSAASCASTSTAMPSVVRDRLQLQHARGLERGDDQQDAIRARGARLVHLVRVDREVLAQHRQPAGGARLFHVLERALEKLLVGQHRQAGRAVALVARGDRGRIECLAQHAPARARFLDLGDDRRLARRRSCQRSAPAKSRAGCASAGLGAQRRQRLHALCARDFLRS